MVEKPKNLAQLSQLLRLRDRVVPFGAGTKPGLSLVGQRFKGTGVSLAEFSGIQQYQPSEFTFTALAGTPLKEIRDALAENQQYLPFDPPLTDAGATLGGTMIAGLTGSGGFRFGTLRDFLLGAQFVNGTGEVLRSGGKVVKNAAGFDYHKFLVGSAGRFGIVTELTFKVFPQKPATATVVWGAESIGDAVDLVQQLSRGPWELDALDIDGQKCEVLARLRGQNEDSLDARIQRLEELFERRSVILKDEVAAEKWRERSEFEWIPPGDSLVKIPLLPEQIEALDVLCDEARLLRNYSLGGNVAWVSHQAALAVQTEMLDLSLRGMQILGERPDHLSGPLLGKFPTFEIESRLKAKVDPDCRFPP